jgi:hypothetical protein
MQIRLVSVAVGTARWSISTAAGSIRSGPTEVAACVVWSGTNRLQWSQPDQYQLSLAQAAHSEVSASD